MQGTYIKEGREIDYTAGADIDAGDVVVRMRNTPFQQCRNLQASGCAVYKPHSGEDQQSTEEHVGCDRLVQKQG